MTKIAQDINISRNQLNDIFAYLEKAGLIGRLRSNVSGISGQRNAYIVKDDIETAGLTTLPLWTFGMMY